MSEQIRKHGNNPGVGFESEDLGSRGILSFLIGLAVCTALIYFGLHGALRVAEHYDQTHQPEQNPLVKTETETRSVPPQTVEKFPQPRLETNERLELHDFRLNEEKKLNSYGWVDQKAGVVHIPIERAMQLTVERGLPTRPQTGTTPPSVVNTAREAAQQSDASRSRKQRRK
jgi:hypothetical protein